MSGHLLGALFSRLEFVEWKGSAWDREWKQGDVIRLSDGRFLLVGDLNQLLGVCDDCKVDVEEVTGYANILDLIR